MPSTAPVFRRVLLVNASLATLIFTICFGLFLAVTLRMDNDFAEYAKQHHVSTVIWANVKLVPAYAILALAYTLLGYPLVRGRSGPKRGSWRAVIGWVLAVNILIAISSFGLSAWTNGGFLDTLARQIGRVRPDLNVYRILELPIVETLLFIFLGLLVFAVVTYARLLGKKRSIAAAAVILVSTGAIALAGARPSHRPASKKIGAPHVIVIGSDSLRADHLSCYGYERLTSPNIDRVAKEGVTFDAFHVATASTLESWTTLLSGKFPVTHGIRYMFPNRERVAAASSNSDTLPRVLNRAGYHTAVSSNWAGNCFSLIDSGFTANRASQVQNLDVFIAETVLIAHVVFPIYFNNRIGEVIYPDVRQITSYLNPNALIDRFEDELDVSLAKGTPFFGVLFTSTTHLPYAASYPNNRKWVDKSYVGANQYEIDFEVDGFMANGFRDALSKSEVQHIIDLYDGAVSEFDETVARVMSALESRGILDDSIVIITSDHPDDLYEPGCTLGHGTSFFAGDASSQIPMIVRLPKAAEAGRRIAPIGRTADFAPTVLDLLGLPVPESYEGVSLAPAMHGKVGPLDLPVLAETCYLFFAKKLHPEGALKTRPADKTLFIDPTFDNNFVLKEEYHDQVLATKDRMIRTPRWKLIWIPGEKGPIFRLYDMVKDPAQTTDLSETHPELRQRLAAMIDRYWNGETDLRWPPEFDQL